MNSASPAQYLVRELLGGEWPVGVWLADVWLADVGLVDVGQGWVPAAGVSRSTQINQPLL
jgi:hypothetical protein